jgi:hypothetical protein
MDERLFRGKTFLGSMEHEKKGATVHSPGLRLMSSKAVLIDRSEVLSGYLRFSYGS